MPPTRALRRTRTPTVILVVVVVVVLVCVLALFLATPTHSPLPTLSMSVSAHRAIRHPTPHLELYHYPALLSAEECDALLDVPPSAFSRGRTVDPGTDNAQAVHQSRTSTTLTLPADKQALFHEWVAARLPHIWEHHDHEPTQLARYTAGQHYDYHHDYFDAAALASTNPTTPTRQRTWTLLVYLNDLEPHTAAAGRRTGRRRTGRRPEHASGGTHFGHPDVDVLFTPKRGSAILWNNLLPDGTPNVKTLHAGKPLANGHTKTIVTQWFLEKGTV